jgi:hypothetical protein
MKKLPLLALAIFIYNTVFLLACTKKQITIEEPKVENCLKVRFLGVGCKHAFFETLDTTKFKGTYIKNWSGTDKGSASADNSFVFVNYYQDTSLVKKLIMNQIYFVEYEFVKEKLTPFDLRRCYPDPSYFEQLIITNILTSNCTIQK